MQIRFNYANLLYSVNKFQNLCQTNQEDGWVWWEVEDIYIGTITYYCLKSFNNFRLVII